jgi:undecaprenyl-diphosphatase
VEDYGSLTMRDRLHRWDRSLLGHARRRERPWTDRALVRITTAANHSRLWLGIAALLAILGGTRGRAAAERGLISVAIASAFANGPAKLLVRRRRPHPHRPRPSLIGMPRTTSFPSGHSASALAFATGAALELPAATPALFALAGGVAYSRVHVGVHYPSDVAAGAAIGVGSGLLAGPLRGALPRKSPQARPGAQLGPDPVHER